MTTTQTITAGTEFAETARRYFSIGTSTRRYRKDKYGRRDMHRAITDAVEMALTMPGFFSDSTQQALRLAAGAVRSYEKHIQGYRMDGDLIARINGMSAYQFVNLLADMVDAGVTNVGEGERYFQAMR